MKKSELYSLLWEACNKLRGGVEPARYKDYVLVLLFFKYVSDRYKGQKFAEFTISKGASFEDLIEAKGKSDVGERADKIIQKFLEDNQLIGSLPDVSFNNADELGSGKELVDKVSGLIGVFQNPAIDFKNNRASGDDIIGDAYEYFMMKFAQESGKSKGQFYTPSEVSRIIARLIGIADIKESPNKKWTLYDPAAGSGSLLIRAADEAPVNANGDSIVTIFGQESDRATAGLAKMNLILHQKGTGEIQRGNTLSSPKFIDEFGELKKFDFIVMNPPFSDKDWSDGIKTTEDEYKRFDGYGIPPEKNGDYAWFLHVLKSLDSNGKAGFVMPHGVLFRGNSEETIRQQILKKRYIKAIISLPANLFYGTGIPACIIILDKENTDTREDIFLIDASRGFKKDGNKNRLREQDIEKIVQTYTNRVEIKGYSKIVKYTDVLDENTNNGNLNVPRYIQKIDETLPQNIAAHLKGGIPETDIESLEKLWNIAPELKNIIFKCIDEVHKVYHTIPFIQNKDFEKFQINYETDFHIPMEVAMIYPKILLCEKCLLISISGRIGNVAVFDNKIKAFAGGAVGIIKLKDPDMAEWCMLYLLSSKGQSQIFKNEKVGAQHNLTVADVRSLKIQIPEVNERNEIVEIIKGMDSEIANLEEERDKMIQIRDGAMDDLLSGRVRLEN